MRPIDARGLRIGVFVHAVVVFAAGTAVARRPGVLDALGLVLVAAAVGGYVTARFVRSAFDAAHTAFVGGTIGGLLAATVFVTGVRADAATGAYWRFHYALATVGLPSWLVVDYGDLVVLVAGLGLGALYAFAALAGGAIAVGDILHVEGAGGPEDRP